MIGVQYKDGSSYNGPLKENGLKDGIGKFQMNQGAKYVGHFVNGQCEGLGTYELPAGAGRYCGSFKNNKFDGYGVLENEGMKYEGQFQNGQIQGSGKITFKDKTNGIPRHEGYFENGRLTRHEQCQQAVQEANNTAEKARNLKV